MSNPPRLLDPGYELTLRPMRYPRFYEMYRDAIKNTWTVEEINLSTDVPDLRKMSPDEQHLVKRLIAFFATGDCIVGNNVIMSLYRHINAPEARMYLSRQLFEEALHVQFYLTLLDTYLPDDKERAAAFKAVETVPSIKAKADFCAKYMDPINELPHIDGLTTRAHKQQFLLNLICFAACVEGLFFFAAFAYVYWLRSKGLCHGLASGTNWVFRDESCHMAFAFAVIDTIRTEEPELFDSALQGRVTQMIQDALYTELMFAKDAICDVSGMSVQNMEQYLQYVADDRLQLLGLQPVYNVKNPFDFMNLQDVQELTNFFERRVAAYQTSIEGEVRFDEEF